MKVDRPADETVIEGTTEVVGAWSSDDAFFFLYIVLEDMLFCLTEIYVKFQSNVIIT